MGMAANRHRASTALRLVLVSSLIVGDLAGCANGGGMFSSKVDPNDACGVQHRDFADSQNYYMSAAAQGALTGAVGGAAIGALFAAATGGNVARGAAIGAGSGAVAGAYQGYWNAKQKDIQDQSKLSQSIYDDVRKASTELDRVDHTFATLWQCRREHAALVKAQYRQGTLTHDQAAKDLADQQSRFKDELALAHKYGAKMADQAQSFQVAAQNLAKDDPAAQQALNSPRHYGLAAPAPTATGGFIINTAANIRKAPSAAAERIVGLFPGAQVQAPDPADANGWRKITFNGGQEGYVLDKFLSPAGTPLPGAATKPATPAAPAAPAAPPPEPTDTKVAVAQNVTETIPEKREHYDKSVGDAEKDSAIAFNLDQPGTNG